MESRSPLVYFLGNRPLWEGRYADLWSIAHFVAGTLIAYVLMRIGIGFWPGLGIAVLIGVVWELFEKFTKLSATEYATNNVTDVLFSSLGFIIAFHVFSAPLALLVRHGILIALALVFIGTDILGWVSYTYYRSADAGITS